MMTRRRTTAGLAAIVGACALVVAVGPLMSSAAPPDDTYELTVTPTDVTQGDVLSVSGTCYSEMIGTADEAYVRLYRQVPAGSGLEPYSVSVTLDVDLGDATFSGELTVPLDAPAGEYRASGLCRWADQATDLPSYEVTVTGEPTSTTSTSTTTTEVGSTTTSTTPAATAVEGEAQLTG